MCVLAHPDDESLGVGGTLAHYARQGVETYLVTATRGERGRFGKGEELPGLDVVGRAREGELRAAAKELGVHDVQFLNYFGGDLDQADPREAVAKIVGHLRRVKPHIVITFDPSGAYGHPDHVAIYQFTTAAIPCSADPAYPVPGQRAAPHRVSKLYYMAWPPDKWAAHQAALKALCATVDGVVRQASPWPDWAITTVIDTSETWETTWRAVSCHQTQMLVYKKLESLPPEHHRPLWGMQEYYRVFSTVNGGRARETDVFEGLR